MERHSPTPTDGRSFTAFQARRQDRRLLSPTAAPIPTIRPSIMQVDVDSGQESSDEDVILHVMVIGFHHKKGSQVDYCHPPLVVSPETKETSDLSPDEMPLPVTWKSLPTLALPDGAHNFISDTVFFHLPVLNDGSAGATGHRDEDQVFCVSCYKQVVASDSLKETDSSFTRSTIMKAVVVISRLPFYGLIAAKTESMTRVYFKQHDFRDKSCLIELHSNLNYVLRKSQRGLISPTDASLLSLSPSRYLISLFGHRVIVLLKLLLLEKKVLFYLNLSSNPTPALSNTVTQYQSFSEAVAGTGVPCDGCDSPPTVKSLCLMVLTLTSLLPSSFESHTKDYHLYCNHCQAAVDKQTEDDTRADIQSVPPLNVFVHGNEVHPYLCLSHIDQIAEYPACIVGATNALFKQKKSALFDVSVDCESGRIEFEDTELKKILTPTTEDLRFADFICKHAIACNPSLDPRTGGRDFASDSFEGGDDWLRIQFNVYLLHALRTSFLRDDSKEVSSFNSSFMRHWKEKTENYKRWKESFLTSILNKESDADQVEVIIRKSFKNIKPGHPFSNSKSTNVSNVMTDMKLRFLSSYGPSLFPAQSQSSSSSSSPINSKNSNVSPNEKKVGVLDASRTAISSAKSTFTSWINSYPALQSDASSGDGDEDSRPSDSSIRDFDEGLRFSSLLRRQEEERDEVVYDRKDFVP